MDKTELNDIPSYAEVYTLNEWKIHVSSGLFTPDDGHGYYATGDKELSPRFQLGEDGIFDLGSFPEWVTHVTWYNK